MICYSSTSRQQTNLIKNIFENLLSSACVFKKVAYNFYLLCHFDLNKRTMSKSIRSQYVVYLQISNLKLCTLYSHKLKKFQTEYLRSTSFVIDESLYWCKCCHIGQKYKRFARQITFRGFYFTGSIWSLDMSASNHIRVSVYVVRQYKRPAKIRRRPKTTMDAEIDLSACDLYFSTVIPFST